MKKYSDLLVSLLIIGGMLLCFFLLSGCSIGMGVQVGKADTDAQWKQAKASLPPVPEDAPNFERGF